MDERDIGYLERALDLAEHGRGCTSPNPIVGALIVRDGVTLGEGWHAGAGLDHAEVAAIRDALGRAGKGQGGADLDPDSVRAVCAGSTMYVTLEPCCTQGRTPPCTSALAMGSFARVVAAAIDPSRAVNGKGLEQLRRAGIVAEVADGAIALRAKRQNNGLRKTIARGLPFVEYKYAMSIDGRVATDSGDSRWISGQASRELVHHWRAWADAVVVGAGTATRDDPTLTARDVECILQPLRVVIDKECALPSGSNLVKTVTEGPVLVVCGKNVGPERLAVVQGWGVRTAQVGFDETGELDPEQSCRALGQAGVQSVLLEGGPRLAAAWWAAGLVDKVSAFVSPCVVSGNAGGGPLRGTGAVNMQEASQLNEVEVLRVGEDVLITGYREGPF